jgi:hypothetical protein
LSVILISYPLDCKIYTRKSDSLELIKLYDSTSGTNWRHKSGWYDFSPVTEWYGIELKVQKSGQDSIYIVKKILLHSNNLKGKLPSLNLPDLESLYLPANDLSGQIPELNLPKLRILYLPGNKLNGEIPVLDLPALEVLELSGNSLTGELQKMELPSLRLLNLSNNTLTGNLHDFDCENLEKIYLNNNKITGVIPEFNCPKLILIDLSNNELTGNIPALNLSELKTMNFGRNSLSGKIPKFDLPNLENLNLSYNELNGNIPEMNLPVLKEIELHFNSLSGKLELGKSLLITSIRVNNNFLTDLCNLSDHTNLSILKVQNNKLSFEDIENNTGIDDFVYSDQDTVLPICLVRTDTSFTLTVTSNGEYNNYKWMRDDKIVTGATDKNYSGTEMGNYQCVVTNSKAPNLVLKSKIVNPMKVIHAFKNDSLELVKLYNSTHGSEWKRNENWLSENLILHWHGVETDTIVKGKDSLLVVSSVNLANNNMKGKLPMLNLEYLRNLELFHNELYGEIDKIQNPKLENLDLSNNLFTGRIPELKCPLLKNCDLSNNDFSHNIPDLNMEKLEYLNLSNNNLTGNIPMFNLPNLDLLALNNNELEGIIPECNFPLLTILELCKNKLCGEFTSLKAPNLRFISIDNNMISELPEMKDYKSLEYLSVEYNKLSFEDIEKNMHIETFFYQEQDTVLPVEVKYFDGEFELRLTANGIANRYQWQRNKFDMLGKNEKVIRVISEAEYRCKVTNSIVEDLTLYSEIINPATINVEDGNKNDIEIDVYPNPARDKISIRYFSKEKSMIEIHLINERGDKVIALKDVIANEGENIIPVNTSTLFSGNYFLKIKKENKCNILNVKIIR